jgi:hypothetical protein
VNLQLPIGVGLCGVILCSCSIWDEEAASSGKQHVRGSMALTQEGAWEFHQDDGRITTGTWRHVGIDDLSKMGTEWRQYAQTNAYRGVLMVWWDGAKTSPYLVETYLAGRLDGLSCAWNERGELRAVEYMRHGQCQAGLWWLNGCLDEASVMTTNGWSDLLRPQGQP